MGSIFTRIINREVQSYIINENDGFIAFLDINPLKKGHTLVVPKKEIDYFFDIDDEYLQQFIVFTKKTAVKIKNVIPCKRVAMSVIGLEIPHAHIHLIPINEIEDVNFCKCTEHVSKEEMQKICDLIKKA